MTSCRGSAEVYQFPTALPPSKIMLSNLNRPLLPTLSHSVPDLLGVPEVKPRATALGFEASFLSDSEDDKLAGKKGKKRTEDSSSELSPDADTEGSNSDSDSEGDTSSSTSTSNPSLSSLSASTVTTVKSKKDKKPKKPLPKNVRDVERALVANWHHVSGETEAFIGRPRHQLENRTGMEVAVMTL